MMSKVIVAMALLGATTEAAFKMGRPAVIAEGNPYADVEAFYVNPSYKTELQGSIDTASGTVKETLTSMLDVPSAYWIDVKSKILGNGTSSVQGILTDAASKSTPPLVTLIVYDLPNRDCKAKASNGEICCIYNDDGTCDYDTNPGTCDDGLKEYYDDYIDPFASILANFEGKVPIVLIIEPDSLANMATNMADPHCSNSASAYETGIPYAIKTLKTACPSCSLYMDAAHGGWLGWEDGYTSFVSLVKDLGIETYLRGFATNVANYQTIGTQCSSDIDCIEGPGKDDPCCTDPCDLLSQYNRANNEMNYVSILKTAMTASMPSFDPHFIIDSGRNGVADMRNDCANWCNARGAGVGYIPTTETNNPANVDAYFWLKTPGESDGCTQYLPDPSDPTGMTKGDACPRYDSMCGSTDSLGSKSDEPYSPEAGKWFDYQIKMLAENAVLYNDDDTVVTDDTPSTTDDTPSTTDDNSSDCAELYAQCGGTGWTGATTCCSGTCTASGDYYSQCTPSKVA